MVNPGNFRRKHRWFQKVLLFTLAMAIVLSSHNPGALSQGNGVEPLLPPPVNHPVPPSLLAWHSASHDDYFDQIHGTNLGYLLWSQFPVKIYLDLPPQLDPTIAEDGRLIQWGEAVTQAVGEWGQYLPLTITKDAAIADILIHPLQPPLQRQINPATGRLELTRARAGTTDYDLYLTPDRPPYLKHRMTIQIKPGQGQQTILGSARHELGHALGLWGHSDQPTDALYPAQVADPPPISPRDVNTLKRVYLQATRLGNPLQL